MAGSSDKLQMRQLLIDAITMLCKNGLQYQAEVTIDGLLALTVDQEQVIVVPIRETIKRKQAESPARCSRSLEENKNNHCDIQEGSIKMEPSQRKRRRKVSSSSVDNKHSTDVAHVAIKQEVVSDNDSDMGVVEDSGFPQGAQVGSDHVGVNSYSDISPTEEQRLSQWPNSINSLPERAGLPPKEDAPVSLLLLTLWGLVTPYMVLSI